MFGEIFYLRFQEQQLTFENHRLQKEVASLRQNMYLLQQYLKQRQLCSPPRSPRASLSPVMSYSDRDNDANTMLSEHTGMLFHFQPSGSASYG